MPEAPPSQLPLVSIVVPCFNEEVILEDSLGELTRYLEGEPIISRYRWELLVIDDGSTDATPQIVERWQEKEPQVRLAQHHLNGGLCKAIKTGFAEARGDYIVTIDADLSYAPGHIGSLLDKLIEEKADIAVASPYMDGGQVSNVPFKRLLLSRYANRFIHLTSAEDISTFTGLVRAYDARFAERLDLKSAGMDVNPEIIYKAILLRARIVEVPAHLNWGEELVEGGGRQSKMQVPWNTLAILFSGFVFRPFLFFFIPGILLGMIATYAWVWGFIHIGSAFFELPSAWILDRLSDALGNAFREFPHTYVIGSIAGIFAMQLLSLGILSMQNKRYFEEGFHLGTTIFDHVRPKRKATP